MNRHAVIAFTAVVFIAAGGGYLLTSVDKPGPKMTGAIKVVAPSRSAAPSNDAAEIVVPAQILEEYKKPDQQLKFDAPPPVQHDWPDVILLSESPAPSATTSSDGTAVTEPKKPPTQGNQAATTELPAPKTGSIFDPPPPAPKFDAPPQPKLPLINPTLPPTPRK